MAQTTHHAYIPQYCHSVPGILTIKPSTELVLMQPAFPCLPVNVAFSHGGHLDGMYCDIGCEGALVDDPKSRSISQPTTWWLGIWELPDTRIMAYAAYKLHVLISYLYVMHSGYKGIINNTV